MRLLDVENNSSVEVQLMRSITTQNLSDWYGRWQPALGRILDELVERGTPQAEWPQSAHWDWHAKSVEMERLLRYEGFSIVHDGVTQGMMRVDLTYFSRVEANGGRELVFVDYLEAAPWNRPELGRTPRFRGVGSALITAAIDLSREQGWNGRIGLNSLPQADGFYRNTCGMTDLGPDPRYEGRMRYFEMTPDQATAFLTV